MGDAENVKTDKVKAEKTKAPKKSWFKGLKSEFKKITWPDKKTLGKQTVAVVSLSVVLCIVISIIDALVTYGVDFLVR